MAKVKGPRKYFFRGRRKDVDLAFYQAFDEDFLLNKAAALYFIVDTFADFKPFAESKGFDFEGKEKLFLDSLRAQIHFTEIHQAEALFALLFAAAQPLPDWVYLTEYETGEIRRSVQRYVNGDIRSLTNDRTNDLYEFLQFAVYSGIEAETEEIRSRWSTNLDNISWLLRRIGVKYLDAPEYNAYKHGLRVLAGGTRLVMYPHDRPEQAVTILQSPDSLTFLEVKNRGKDRQTVHHTTKHFSVKESYAHLIAMSRLARAMKCTRLGVLTGANRAELPTFFEVNKDQLLNLAVVGRFSFTL